MATAAGFLTLDEYHERYAGENAYEYWFGEAIKKSVPTWLHAILQVILAEVFYKAGYISGSELDLRIDPNWDPRPDVVAALQPEHPYPTKPVNIVAEVLSPDDRMSRIYEKCRQYARIGIPQILVFDPEARVAWEWSRATENLERIHQLHLDNGAVLLVKDIWDELYCRSKQREA